MRIAGFNLRDGFRNFSRHIFATGFCDEQIILNADADFLIIGFSVQLDAKRPVESRFIAYQPSRFHGFAEVIAERVAVVFLLTHQVADTMRSGFILEFALPPSLMKNIN